MWRPEASRSGVLPLHPQHPRLLPELGPPALPMAAAMVQLIPCDILQNAVQEDFFPGELLNLSAHKRHCEESSCDGAVCIPLLLHPFPVAGGG